MPGSLLQARNGICYMACEGFVPYEKKDIRCKNEIGRAKGGRESAR